MEELWLAPIFKNITFRKIMDSLSNFLIPFMGVDTKNQITNAKNYSFSKYLKNTVCSFEIKSFQDFLGFGKCIFGIISFGNWIFFYPLHFFVLKTFFVKELGNKFDKKTRNLDFGLKIGKKKTGKIDFVERMHKFYRKYYEVSRLFKMRR